MKNSVLKTKKVKLDRFGIDLRYAELGNPKNPAILLLHGVPENLQTWYDVAPELAKDYHVLAIDWPGFGGSEPFHKSSDYNSIRFAEVAIDFLNTKMIAKANIMATDIGLLPALIMGMDFPDRIEDLIVMDGIPLPTTEYSSWELKSFQKKGSIRAKALIEWFPKISALIAYNKGFYKGHSIPKPVLKEFLADGRNKSNQKAFLSYFQNFYIGQQYFEKEASRMEKDVLVMWGKHDRFINVEIADRIAKMLPNSRLEIVEDSGHYLHMDRPQKLLDSSFKFLNRNKTLTIENADQRSIAV